MNDIEEERTAKKPRSQGLGSNNNFCSFFVSFVSFVVKKMLNHEVAHAAV